MPITYGDTTETDCPFCGKHIRDLWDFGPSGLHVGRIFDCPHCAQKCRIVSVETITHVILDRDHADNSEGNKEI